jgi:hypothetical protein
VYLAGVSCGGLGSWPAAPPARRRARR